MWLAPMVQRASRRLSGTPAGQTRQPVSAPEILTRRALFESFLGHRSASADATEGLRVDQPELAAPTRCASIAELHELALAAGLEHRYELIDSLSMVSLRLVRAPAEDRSANGWVSMTPGAGTVAALSSGSSNEGSTAFAELAAALSEAGMRFARPRSPSSRVLRASVDACGSPREPAAAHMIVRIAPERVLPRAWSEAVQRSGIEPGEVQAWEWMRSRLAETQGSLMPTSTDSFIVHRLLGYPDERRGLMPAMCADAAGGNPHDWRLLLQLTPSAHAADMPIASRVYFWITWAQFAASDLSNVWVIEQ